MAAEVGAFSAGEKTLANRLYQRLHCDELLTADRNFYSFTAWDLASRSGAGLLWRAPTGLGLPIVKILSDGTYLSVLINPSIRGARRRAAILATASEITAGGVAELDPTEAHLVRVVEYDVPDRVGTGTGTGELIVVLSNIVDPAAAHADELASAYHQRWEEETGNDQLKTHLRGPGKILRSKLPELVHQEIWAWLLVHHATSDLITRAAEAADLAPDRVSFTRVLRITRRTATGTAGFPPEDFDRVLPSVLAEITRKINPAAAPPQLPTRGQTRPPQQLPRQTTRRHRYPTHRPSHHQYPHSDTPSSLINLSYVALTLGYRTPAEVFVDLLASSIASTG